jgi:NADPH:quinone reductase-like Zn-dependent oxidoreductase
MPYPRVIPHSDGAERIDEVGEGVPSNSVGRAVWCYGAQSHRPFGTAAEFTVEIGAQRDRLQRLEKQIDEQRRENQTLQERLYKLEAAFASPSHASGTLGGR